MDTDTRYLCSANPHEIINQRVAAFLETRISARSHNTATIYGKRFPKGDIPAIIQLTALRCTGVGIFVVQVRQQFERMEATMTTERPAGRFSNSERPIQIGEYEVQVQIIPADID